MNKNANLPLLINLAIPLLIATISGIITSASIPTWYTNLVKPEFTPPNYVFAPVWTLLYLLMGISFYLIWKKRKVLNITISTILYSVQLTLNFLWSLLFFGMRNPLLSLIEITCLWIFILLMIGAFWKISKISSLLQIPYLMWVTFAGVLNFYIWKLN